MKKSRRAKMESGGVWASGVELVHDHASKLYSESYPSGLRELVLGTERHMALTET